MQAFGRITSGLIAAQTGLYVTGHNMSNTATPGYTRQRVNPADAAYNIVGVNGNGNMKVGLGAKILSTTQIRDDFLDKTYRTASSKANFYSTKLDAINEIENIIGELYGDARLSANIDEMWASLQELATHPDGYETRAMFMQSAIRFVTKTNEVSEGLYDYQKTLNDKIISSVNHINEITTKIEALNKKIMQAELTGDNANDYRDSRNLLVDALAAYGDIEVREEYSGRINILMEGKDLVSNGSAKMLGLRYITDQRYPFVEPVFNEDYVKDGKILRSSEYGMRLFTDLDSGLIGGTLDNDYGGLKALMITRGKYPANYTTLASDVNSYTIPKFQKELDTLVNKIVTLVNDILSPWEYNDKDAAPMGLQGEQFIEVFSRKHVERYEYDADGNIVNVNEENPKDKKTLYSMGNIVINEEVLNNFNALCLSHTGDRADTSVIQKLLGIWKGEGTLFETSKYLPRIEMPTFPVSYSEYLSFEDYYKEVITRLGEEGSTADIYVTSQEYIVNDAAAARQSLSGVALDEELTEMMKFQHAYDAAAKMVNVIDGMIDLIVNGLKR